MFNRHGSSLYPRPWPGETAGKRVYLSQRTPFNEIAVAEFTPLIELKSNYGVSALRDITSTTGSGSITNSSGEFNVSTGATASSNATFNSAERGRYQPGIVGLPGLAIRRPTAPTGNQSLKWGYFDDQNGFFLGEDSGGVFAELRRGGSQIEKTYQADWTCDRLDGSGGVDNPSGLTLDLTKYTICRFPFVWYGGGPIQFELVLTDPNDRNRPVNVIVHRMQAVSNAPIVEDPNLPIRAEADNGGDASDIGLFVAGRQFAVQGRYAPNRRITGETVVEKSLSGTTPVPLVTFRKKTAFESVSVKIAGEGVLSSNDLIVSIVLDGSLTGATFGSLADINDAETALEVDTAATAISGGNVVYEALAAGGVGGRTLTGITNLGLDIPAQQPITLMARRVSSTGGTATATFRMEEEW